MRTLVVLGLAGAALLVPTAVYFTHHRTPAQAAQQLAPTSIASWFREPAALSICQNLYAAVCARRGPSRDPTGEVIPDVEGEIKALRLYEDITHEHPDWESSQVDEELVQRIYTPELRSRIRAAFQWVRRDEEKFIDRQPADVFTPREKHFLKQRLHNLHLELPPPASIYADEPDLYTKNDVYYERTADGYLRLRVGGAFLFTVKSWFNLIFTMGHEIAHSIDPCEIRAQRRFLPAYDRLSACFMRNGLVAARRTRLECGENDQLSETFADWVGVHVTADALATFATEFHGQQIVNAAANSVRDLCEQDETGDEVDLEYHPSPEVRIDRIFGRNPAIRDLLGCGPVTAGPEYCSFESKIDDPYFRR